MAIINGDQNPNNLNDELIGTQVNDIINGLSGNDFIITGGDGNDRLNGGSGNDQLFDDAGNDTLDGGMGDDFMAAGKGDDTYVVDSSKDTVSEVANEGIDRVVSTATTFRLPNNVENLQLFHSDTKFASNGLGNDLDNIIQGNEVANALRGFGGGDLLSGNSGDDLLDGGDEDDTLIGGPGNDLINGGAGNDKAVVNGDFDFTVTNTSISSFDQASPFNPEHFGMDTLQNIERVKVQGGSLPNQQDATNFTGSADLNGAGGSDVLLGGSGDDTLFGGAGDDQLSGGAGSDEFTFIGNPANFSATVGVDIITDLEGNDKIVLSKLTFTALMSQEGDGFSVASEFAVVADDSAAETSQALIVYSISTGNLFYNQNGSAAGFGTGGQFATLPNKPKLAAANFSLQFV